MEYMFREGNHKFRKAVSIINLYAIVISFNLFHILNIDVNHIKMLINNNDANGLVRYREYDIHLLIHIIIHIIINIDVNHIKMPINNNDDNGLVRYRGI